MPHNKSHRTHEQQNMASMKDEAHTPSSQKQRNLPPSLNQVGKQENR
ncbi:hypothetical protein [Marinicrinis sediminis]|uniref:Uncharacterized protein n=1 Tax=Marinicrinis sediminis TaxID=1652465 RepID=A0ABW5RDV3_9BACL